MNVNIDIREVVSESEIKEVVLDAIREAVLETYRGNEQNMNRLISNLAYDFVYDMVDEQFDNNLTDFLKNKISEVIQELKVYHVFRQKDVWERESSIGHQLLEEEILGSQPLIKKRVEEVIEEYPFHEVKDSISDVVYECVMGKLFDQGAESL